MYTKTTSNIPPLLQSHPQSLLKMPVSKPSIPPLLSNQTFNDQPRPKLNIIRHDRISTTNILENLVTSLEEHHARPTIDQEPLEILSTDFKHGLYPSVSTTSYVSLWNTEVPADSGPTGNAPNQPPPSLLSLKVEEPKNFQKRNHVENGNASGNRPETNVNLFPIPPELNESTSTKFRTTGVDEKNLTIPIEDIMHKPKRSNRPSKLVIILRGMPGSGKSYLTNLIKSEEEKHASDSEKPKVFSIDNYFITEQEETITNCKQAKAKKQTVMKYEYDPSLDEAYQKSLVKSFKKTVDDNLFNFLIVDMVNEKMSQVDEMRLYAKDHGFYTFVIELDHENAEECYLRNVHDRTLQEIEKIQLNWEPLPTDYIKLDVSYFLQLKEIQNVEMEDDFLKEIACGGAAKEIAGEVAVKSAMNDNKSKWDSTTAEDSQNGDKKRKHTEDQDVSDKKSTRNNEDHMKLPNGVLNL